MGAPYSWIHSFIAMYIRSLFTIHWRKYSTIQRFAVFGSRIVSCGNAQQPSIFDTLIRRSCRDCSSLTDLNCFMCTEAGLRSRFKPLPHRWLSSAARLRCRYKSIKSLGKSYIGSIVQLIIHIQEGTGIYDFYTCRRLHYPVQ